jgi:dipeptidyl aminopeptidase/acylaminoacyl peptidase
VHYKSFDDKIIGAFLWVPYNLKRDASNPGIVLPHGGPTDKPWIPSTALRPRWHREDTSA